jgi:oligoendopeptidase F
MNTRIPAGLLGVLLLVGVHPAASAAPSYDDRSQIDEAYRWNLDAIYPEDALWEADFEKLEALIPSMGAYRGRLADGKVLLEALEQRDRIGELYERLLVYASMRHDQDTRVEKYGAIRDRIESVGPRIGELTAYFEPEILALERDALWAMVESTQGLDLYRHHLDEMVRGAEHTLDEEGERLLALASDVTGSFENVFASFHNADIGYGTIKNEKGETVELTKALYSLFQESPDRRVREESWRRFYAAYDEFGRTLASNMSGNVKSHVFGARARGYDSALEASVDPNGIPVDVYRNLIKTVRENIEPLHRYVALRKRILGVDELQVWDMSAPLVEPTATDIPWEAAVTMVTEGLSILGDEYMTPFEKGLASRWADVYETPGKRSGAYSWGGYSTMPYLLLNYNGTLESVFTLAHEMGHSMHSYFSWANQPFVYGDYSIFVAEVASTANEAILIEKMLAETREKAERAFLINHYLEQIRGTFFTQVMFADVELQMHEMVERGEPLTKDALDRVYNDTYAFYFGPALTVEPINGAAWSRIPHFYYNFYMYQYATSYAAATALAKSIMAEGAPAVTRLLDFLKAGSSDYPIEVLRRAGVDMTRPEPVLDTIAVFEGLLDRMESELAQR